MNKSKERRNNMTDKEILELNEKQRQPVECWTRVMGYFRPYSQFNIGKKAEFDERVWFVEQGEKE